MTARGLGDEQCQELEIEDDLECECGCRISEEDCLSTQVEIFDLYRHIFSYDSQSQGSRIS